jgi:hypothetical protein
MTLKTNIVKMIREDIVRLQRDTKKTSVSNHEYIEIKVTDLGMIVNNILSLLDEIVQRLSETEERRRIIVRRKSKSKNRKLERRRRC